jgi:hypothetical protein
VRVYTDSEGRIRLDTTQKAPEQLAKNTNNQTNVENNRNTAKPQDVTQNTVKNTSAATVKPQVINTNKTSREPIYKDGFRQHSYIKVYRDKDGKTRLDTTSFERPK